MAIFAKKHFSHSSFFLMFLRLGIFFRTIVAYANRQKKELFKIIFDLSAINVCMLVASKIRFGAFLPFDDYAYPTVFIAITVVLFGSMLAVGEYFEKNTSIKKTFFALMISFFILSSLTYYFKDFAFSRGILLMTVGLAVVTSTLMRSIFMIYDKASGKDADKRIAFVGINDKTMNMIKALQGVDTRNANLVGLISVSTNSENNTGLPVLGNIDYFSKIIEENKIHEVIITDTKIAGNELIRLISSSAGQNIRFHVAQEYEEVLAARIINEVSGLEPTVPEFNITKLRSRILKRLTDLAVSFFF